LNLGESVVNMGSEPRAVFCFFLGAGKGGGFRYECFFLERVGRREKTEVTIFFLQMLDIIGKSG